MNNQMAIDILTSLRRWGLQEVCLCPGGRNAPFVVGLESQNEIQVHTGFDERSAAFFALGRILETGKPVAVITTSGTAVAETLPAIIEAHYQQLPLVVVSADRPKRFRGMGVPQTVEQHTLLNQYVEKSFDVDVRWDKNLSTWSLRQPLHINPCFEEPLIDSEVSMPKEISPYQKPASPLMLWRGRQWVTASLRDVSAEFSASFLKSKKPLLVVSDMSMNEAYDVEPFVRSWPGYVYVEATSGLKEHDFKNQLKFDAHVQSLLQSKDIDCVVRLGGVPTARFWRDLEKLAVPVWSFAFRAFSGLSRGQCCWLESRLLAEFQPLLKKQVQLGTNTEQESQRISDKVDSHLKSHPLSEAAWVRWLSQQVQADHAVYVGNSLPIREWDLVSQCANPQKVYANRGANGIDGQLSTAIGLLQEGRPLWALLGDITTLYDVNALWYWAQKKSLPLRLVVMNNRGGRIFERLFDSPLFLNEHHLHFESVAKQWGLPYFFFEKQQDIPDKQSFLLEITPDLSQSEMFWNVLKEATS